MQLVGQTDWPKQQTRSKTENAMQAMRTDNIYVNIHNVHHNYICLREPMYHISLLCSLKQNIYIYICIYMHYRGGHPSIYTIYHMMYICALWGSLASIYTHYSWSSIHVYIHIYIYIYIYTCVIGRPSIYIWYTIYHTNIHIHIYIYISEYTWRTPYNSYT